MLIQEDFFTTTGFVFLTIFTCCMIKLLKTVGTGKNKQNLAPP